MQNIELKPGKNAGRGFFQMMRNRRKHNIKKAGYALLG